MIRVITAIALGFAVTGLMTLFERPYCMDGRGRGLPFAVIHPAHWRQIPGEPLPERGDEIFSILLRTDRNFPPSVNVLAIPANVAFWSCAAIYIMRRIERRRADSERELSATEIRNA